MSRNPTPDLERVFTSTGRERDILQVLTKRVRMFEVLKYSKKLLNIKILLTLQKISRSNEKIH